MTDREKINEIKANIYSRPYHVLGVYENISIASGINFKWHPNIGENYPRTISKALLLQKQANIIDTLLIEAVERGENIQDESVLKRIGLETFRQTSGAKINKIVLIIIVVIIGVIFKHFVF